MKCNVIPAKREKKRSRIESRQTANKLGPTVPEAVMGTVTQRLGNIDGAVISAYHKTVIGNKKVIGTICSEQPLFVITKISK